MSFSTENSYGTDLQSVKSFIYVCIYVTVLWLGVSLLSLALHQYTSFKKSRSTECVLSPLEI